MDTWMVVTALAVALLPFLLMALFQRSNTADASGRRVDRRWRVRREEI